MPPLACPVRTTLDKSEYLRRASSHARPCQGHTVGDPPDPAASGPRLVALPALGPLPQPCESVLIGSGKIPVCGTTHYSRKPMRHIQIQAEVGCHRPELATSNKRATLGAVSNEC